MPRTRAAEQQLARIKALLESSRTQRKPASDAQRLAQIAALLGVERVPAWRQRLRAEALAGGPLSKRHKEAARRFLDAAILGDTQSDRRARRQERRMEAEEARSAWENAMRGIDEMDRTYELASVVLGRVPTESLHEAAQRSKRARSSATRVAARWLLALPNDATPAQRWATLERIARLAPWIR
jgi:hypothetical protein